MERRSNREVLAIVDRQSTPIEPRDKVEASLLASTQRPLDGKWRGIVSIFQGRLALWDRPVKGSRFPTCVKKVDHSDWQFLCS